MKKQFTYIISTLMWLLPALQACSTDDSPVGNRGVQVDLSISARAVAQADGTAEGEPTDIKVWIYGQKTAEDAEAAWERLAYIDKQAGEGVKLFSQTDLHGNPIESIRADLEEGRNYHKLNFYVVVNSKSVTWDSPGEGLSETTSLATLKAATFSGISTGEKKDNEVLMYGNESIEIEDKATYSKEIEVTRSVGKLEVYFTQRSSNVNLKVTGVKLSKLPNKGWLSPESRTLATIGGDGAETTLCSTEKSVSSVLTGEFPAGVFGTQYEEDPSTFTQIPLSQPYLLEREGMSWSTTGNQDALYPPPAAQSNDAYHLILEFSYAQPERDRTETRTLYLPRIERNIRYCFFVRVHLETRVEVNTVAIPWEKGKADLNIDLTPGLDQEDDATSSTVLNTNQ